MMNATKFKKQVVYCLYGRGPKPNVRERTFKRMLARVNMNAIPDYMLNLETDTYRRMLYSIPTNRRP